MLVTWLMRLVADVVLDSAAEMRRSFDTDMRRYLERRGFRTPPPTVSAR